MNDILKISSLIPSFECIHKYNNEHFVFKCKIIDLIKGPFENWEYNRPADKYRSIDIAKYALNINKKQYDLDWILYTFYSSEDEIIKIYDGIHRFEALSLVYQDNTNTNTNNNDLRWLYDKYILISMRLNATFGEISDLFLSLNKNHPVPDLYISNKDNDKKTIIEEVAFEWQQKYKSHFSSNNKPNLPNTNINNFIDILDKIYKKYKINKMNKYLLNDYLNQMNERIKNHIPKKVSLTAVKKCQDSGCYLFLYKKDTLEDMF